MLSEPPTLAVTLEVDRSLLLFDKPGVDPHTGKLLGDASALADDGGPAVVRRRVLVTFEAKLSTHGLPIVVVASYVPLPK